MGGIRFVAILAVLLSALALLVPTGASAQSRPDQPCHAYSDELLPLEAAATTLAWDCTGTGWQDGRRVTWLLFDNWDDNRPPLRFTSRMTVFESIAVAAVATDGSLRAIEYPSAEADAIAAGPAFTVDLPPVAPDTSAFVVRIEAPHSVTIASEASLARNPERQQGVLAATIFLALAIGMLVMPMLFDAMFYFVLRERVVLLHAGMTLAMIVYILTAGGIISAIADLPVNLLAIAAPLAWAIGVACGGLFIANFIERDMLRPRERKGVCAMSLWAMLVPGFAALQFDWSQSFDNQLYFYAFLPVIPTLVGAIVTALLRGSRAARFLAVAWLPVVLAAIDRMLRGMGLYTASDSLDLWLFFSLAFEVMVMGLAVADRFLALRQERDLARIEARTLGELTERDALTGLLNRRAIEERFDMLRAEGFTTLAVVDLDHFKRVNDQYGHSAGDVVLKCVASALRTDDENSLAFRMGGEEFVLLLRGKHALERAETRRIAITKLVAKTGLVREAVTASMGAVEAPHDSLANASFETLYNRADRLLYEAKAAGRDRTMSERLKVFRPRRSHERRAA